MPHLPPAHHETSKRDSPNETKVKEKQNKTKQNCPGFKFKPRQVNDSSQSHQGTDHLVSQIVTRQMVIHTPLNLEAKIYKPSFIVLEGQGIDVILGLSWMKTHKTLLDTAARVVHLESPMHGVATLQL
jgi:hypothetical protein